MVEDKQGYQHLSRALAMPGNARGIIVLGKGGAFRRPWGEAPWSRRSR